MADTGDSALDRTVKAPTVVAPRLSTSDAARIEDLSDDLLLTKVPRAKIGTQDVPVLAGIPLLARLGQGGMGAVYLAVRPRLEDRVAVKVLSSQLLSRDPEQARQAVDRFHREARIATRIHSDRLVQVYDVNHDARSDLHYIVMEFVAGASAGSYCRKISEKSGRGLPEGDALDIIISASEGLHAAHKQGVIHRDIKPDNILLSVDANGKVAFNEAKLADLGLARLEESGQSLTASAQTMGTPGYMAPEQVTEAKSARKPADVFSMGATLYMLLTGHKPFEGETSMNVLVATLQKPPVPIKQWRPDITEPTRRLIEQCLEKDVSVRFPDAAALLAGLKMCREAVNKSQREQADVATFVAELARQGEVGLPFVGDGVAPVVIEPKAPPVSAKPAVKASAAAKKAAPGKSAAPKKSASVSKAVEPDSDSEPVTPRKRGSFIAIIVVAMTVVALAAAAAVSQFGKSKGGDEQGGKAVTPPEITSETEVVWFDDDWPAEGVERKDVADSPWKWASAPDPVFSGKRSHTHEMPRDPKNLPWHWHTMINATAFPVRLQDTLFVYAYVDPRVTPAAMSVTFTAGSNAGRAQWGDIGNVDPARPVTQMGPLPPPGRWARLEIPVATIFKQDVMLNGIGFVHHGGTVFWDKIGVVRGRAPQTAASTITPTISVAPTAPPAKTVEIPAVPPLPADAKEVVWLDEDLPGGAVEAAPTPPGHSWTMGAWKWVTEPAPFSGKWAHTHDPEVARKATLSKHLMYAAMPLQIALQDTVYCHVYVDPQSAPRGIMLELIAEDGSDHRAIWGSFETSLGPVRPGDLRIRMNDVPAAGKWVRLEIPASRIFKADAKITGAIFTQAPGIVYWDRLGVLRGPGSTAAPPAPAPGDVVWMDEEDDCKQEPSPGHGYYPPIWESKSFSGKQSHRHEPPASFRNRISTHLIAAEPLPVRTKDTLYTYVYLDPDTPPQAIMLQFHSAKVWYQAYWGENYFANYARCPRIGPLPPVGQWTRLEIPAFLLLKHDVSLTKMGFTHIRGRVLWDKTGVVRGGFGPFTPPAEAPPPPDDGDAVWIDDDVPGGEFGEPGSAVYPWKWVSPPEPVFSGKTSHTHSPDEKDYHALNAHFTYTPSFRARKNDTLYTYVYLDPKAVPKGIILQFLVGKSWEQRASWGDVVDPRFKSNRVGALPEAGKWVRLEIPVSAIFKDDVYLDGVSFGQQSGRAFWDKFGVERGKAPDAPKTKE